MLWILQNNDPVPSDIRDRRLEELLRKTAEGDREAFGKLYEETRDAVYALLLSLLKNTHDAEDISQDCFIRVYQNAALYRPHGKPLAWIFTVARNLAMTELKRRSRDAQLPEEDWQTLYVEDDSESVRNAQVIRTLMEVLGDEEREIVISHVYTGEKHREIAARLGMPLSTVLSKYNRAIKKMQEKLGG